MLISVKRDTKAGAKKFNNHTVKVNEQLIGYVGHPSIYDHRSYVFIAKDDNYKSLEQIGNVVDFDTMYDYLLQAIPAIHDKITASQQQSIDNQTTTTLVYDKKINW